MFTVTQLYCTITQKPLQGRRISDVISNKAYKESESSKREFYISLNMEWIFKQTMYLNILKPKRNSRHEETKVLWIISLKAKAFT